MRDLKVIQEYCQLRAGVEQAIDGLRFIVRKGHESKNIDGIDLELAVEKLNEAWNTYRDYWEQLKDD